jgi:hypothetical protein
MHHASLRVNGGLHLCLHMCKVIHPSLESSDPLHRVSPTNSLEDEGRLFVHSNPLEQVHIVYTSVSKLLLAERLALLHLLNATDGNVIAIRGHRNIIVCKIADQPLRSHAVKAQRMKTMQSLVIHHRSVSQSLSWMGQMRMLASLHLSISSSCIALATTTHNNKYQVP